MERWEIVTGFNTVTGMREWLESKGASRKKSRELTDRLGKGEVIEFGKGWRMRWEKGGGVGIYYIEKKIQGEGI